MTPRNTAGILTLAFLVAACATAPSRTTSVVNSVVGTEAHASPTAPTDAERERAVHVLNRLAFGPRPDDVERVATMGVDNWIEQQLAVSGELDAKALTALNGCDTWWRDIVDAKAALATAFAYSADGAAMSVDGSRRGPLLVLVGVTVGARDSAFYASAIGPRTAMLLNNQLLGCRLTRVESTDDQLLEVMTDFWQNHFSIWGPSLPSRSEVVAFDREVVRPNALGRFRDMLGAVAHSPAMLAYLDNASSSADPGRSTLEEVRRRAAGDSTYRSPRDGVNENFARELLELHTLGADAGFTQGDVADVARVFTGWTHNGGLLFPRPAARPPFSAADSPAEFFFEPAMHDADAKVVLGHQLPPGRGEEEGEELLDILASHPATALHIARKLAVRFVSDSPSTALVNDAARVFANTDGDIRAVMRSIIGSDEFRGAVGAKVKSPHEYLLSVRRALNSPVDTEAELVELLVLMGQPPLGKVTPNGWPEYGHEWLSAGALRTRLEVIDRIARGRVPSIPLESWPEWGRLKDAPFDEQVAGVVEKLLHGRASENTLAVLRASGAVAGGRELVLRDLIGLALSSPEFQRR